MGWVALAATAGSAIFQGISGYQQGQYAAQVAKNNAQIANWNARLAIQKGQQESEISGLRTGEITGAQRAAAAASGIDPNTGSPIRLQGDTAALGAQDQLTIQNNAALRAWGFQTQATDFLAESQLDQNRASSALVGSLIGGAGSVAEKWNIFKQQGVL